MTSSAAATTQTLSLNASANIRTIAGRRIVTAPNLDWHRSVSTRLEQLVRLDPNWNGYGAPPIPLHLAIFAQSLLQSACHPTSPEPQIVPGPNEDIQIEWHSREYDIELHLIAPFEVSAVRISGDECEEFNLTNDFTVVGEWLSQMEAAVAARAAAA